MEFYNFLASSTRMTYASLEPKGTEYTDFPYTLDHVWILGKKYSVLHDLEEIRRVIRSKIWFTYRSNFPPIGGTGPVSDKHWGCMLRCGQMVMAEALIYKHLGRGWVWNPLGLDPVYLKILKMFQDKKDSPYSIHQIAQMGVSEGKSVGQWFGPNTVAQVLRKLSAYDDWSSVAVHVALDNAVIIEDIKTLCSHTPQPAASKAAQNSYQNFRCSFPIMNNQEEIHNREFGCTKSKCKWRPMLLFIPLRLGLSTLNHIYERGLKSTFMLKQTLGIIGGKPNHALWFIGFIGNELVYLDPHTTQPVVNVDAEKPEDASFHIPYGNSKRMPITDIDPSIALCFYFESEEDFDQWCNHVQKILIVPERQPLFELAAERPSHWPPLELEPDISSGNCSLEFFIVDHEQNVDNSDEEFEIFEPIFPSNKQGSSSTY